MSESEKKEIETKRGAAIYQFCESLHEDIDNLYELMLDGTDEEEKAHIQSIIKKLEELNKDR